MVLAALVLAGGIGFQPHPVLAKPNFVALPKIENSTVTPRIVYIENPRFPRVATDELWKAVQAAASLVEEHFGIKVENPSHIPVLDIDDVFAEAADG